MNQVAKFKKFSKLLSFFFERVFTVSWNMRFALNISPFNYIQSWIA
jgi:hypothetical protein